MPGDPFRKCTAQRKQPAAPHRRRSTSTPTLKAEPGVMFKIAQPKTDRTATRAKFLSVQLWILRRSIMPP